MNGVPLTILAWRMPPSQLARGLHAVTAHALTDPIGGEGTGINTDAPT
jgi:hypothetical protein